MGHSPLAEKFSRAETISGGSLGPPKKRSACRNQRYSRPQSLYAHDDHESEGIEVENES